MAFIDLTSELAGVLPGLSPVLAATYIQRGWRDIRESRLWSFQMADAAVVCPPQVIAGTAAIVRFTSTVTLDAAASAAVAAFTPTGTPLLTQMQIRFALGTGGIYNIISVDNSAPAARILTLDRPVQETTNATSSYQIYRCYIQPPVSDFVRWDSVVDVANGTNLSLDLASIYFDLQDPKRTIAAPAKYCGYYQANNLGTSPLSEIWPHPTTGQTFYTRFIRRGADLSASVSQPDIISDGMIVYRALGWHVLVWAQINENHFPALKSVNWQAAVSDAKVRYMEAYLNARRIDDEIYSRNLVARGDAQVPTPISQPTGV